MTTAPSNVIRGEKTRQRVLDIAVKVATAEGLDALTIGRVAEASALTKAGVIGHFVSKEQLQLSTLRAGSELFLERIVSPAMNAPAGIVRLAALLDRWITHIDGTEGGCFFTSVAAEFDTRKGAVHDAIAAMMHEWLAALVRIIEEAVRLEHLAADTDAEMLAFKLHGYVLSMNLRQQLFAEEQVARRAKAAVHEAVRGVATAAGRRLLARISASNMPAKRRSKVRNRQQRVS